MYIEIYILVNKNRSLNMPPPPSILYETTYIIGRNTQYKFLARLQSRY